MGGSKLPESESFLCFCPPGDFGRLLTLSVNAWGEHTALAGLLGGARESAQGTRLEQCGARVLADIVTAVVMGGFWGGMPGSEFQRQEDCSL